MKKKITIGISGASGVIYGIKLLEHLSNMPDIETHLVITESGIQNINLETSYALEHVYNLANFHYDNQNLAAPIASGSFIVEAMIIMPCTIKTLSGLVNSFNSNLLLRAADVALKENRKLVLSVRETPLHKGHLKLMHSAADLGALILPPVPAFYNKPRHISDIIDQCIGKALDYIGLEHNLYQRWTGA